MARAHGYHKGMSKKWMPRDIPRQVHVKTKTVVVMSKSGRMKAPVTVKVEE